MKIGILGYSSIARRCIIPAIKQIEDLELAGIGSRNVDTGKIHTVDFFIETGDAR